MGQGRALAGPYNGQDNYGDKKAAVCKGRTCGKISDTFETPYFRIKDNIQDDAEHNDQYDRFTRRGRAS